MNRALLNRSLIQIFLSTKEAHNSNRPVMDLTALGLPNFSVLSTYLCRWSSDKAKFRLTNTDWRPLPLWKVSGRSSQRTLPSVRYLQGVLLSHQNTVFTIFIILLRWELAEGQELGFIKLCLAHGMAQGRGPAPALRTAPSMRAKRTTCYQGYIYTDSNQVWSSSRKRKKWFY